MNKIRLLIWIFLIILMALHLIILYSLNWEITSIISFFSIGGLIASIISVFFLLKKANSIYLLISILLSILLIFVFIYFFISNFSCNFDGEEDYFCIFL